MARITGSRRLGAGAGPKIADNPLPPPQMSHPIGQLQNLNLQLVLTWELQIDISNCLLIELSSHTPRIQNQTPNFHPKPALPACSLPHLSRWQLHLSADDQAKNLAHHPFLSYVSHLVLQQILRALSSNMPESPTSYHYYTCSRSLSTLYEGTPPPILHTKHYLPSFQITRLQEGHLFEVVIAWWIFLHVRLFQPQDRDFPSHQLKNNHVQFIGTCALYIQYYSEHLWETDCLVHNLTFDIYQLWDSGFCTSVSSSVKLRVIASASQGCYKD